ncbi:MAG: SHOCT domain-containing protein [Nitrosopumilus sp.]|nr:SHOCT domain-containing protein [Nitrosopumilus sp.]MDH3854916.1 SHOCT domain-containing protein [Nitrosopumilus sp.]
MVQRKKSKKKGDFFEKLKSKATEAKETGSAFGKTAMEKGEVVGRQLADKGKEGLDKGKEFAQTATTSNQDVIDLIEKLGALKKSGLLTDKEFQEKKTELLAKI